MSDKRYTPWSNGSEFMDWYDDQCMHCESGSDGICDASEIKCKHEYSIALACIDDGTIPEETAKFIGYIDNLPNCTGFKKREATND